MLTQLRLRELLEELEGVQDVQITEDGRRMVAVVVSPRFEGLDEGERQQQVWMLLRRNLSAEDLRRVEFVMTDTPAERADALAG